MSKQKTISAAAFFDSHYIEAASHVKTCHTELELDVFNKEQEKRFISSIEDLFRQGMDLSKHLSALHDAPDKTLPATTMLSLSSIIWSIEMLLNSYSDNAAADPNAILSYIAKSRLTKKSSVTLCQDGNSIYIYMPTFPAKGKGNDALVNRMLAAKLFYGDRLPMWDRWSAYFHFVYPSSAFNTAKDVDNYDYKRTIDLIAAAIGRCDNARSFSLHCSSYFTDSFPRGVYIEVSENNSDFPDFSKWDFPHFPEK